MACGVYVIRNITNGKCYYGSSLDIDRRLREHWNALNNSKHPNEHLMSAWRMYGEHAFRFETYKVLDSREEAYELEQWILEAHYDKWDELYNKEKCVFKTVCAEETKQKISATKTGQKIGPHSEERKQKISEAQKGKSRKPLTEEHKLRLSEIAKERNFGKWMLGKKQSEETKQKKSAAAKARRK